MFGKNKENIKFSDDILKKLQLLILDYNISLDNIVNEAYEIAGIEGASSVLATVNQSFIDLVDETKKCVPVYAGTNTKAGCFCCSSSEAHTAAP